MEHSADTASASAARTLDEIDRLRRTTRADLGSFWFPLVLFGALTLGGVAVGLVFGDLAIAFWWAVAGPGGGALTAFHYRRRECAIGVRRFAVPHMATAAGMIVGCFALSALTSGRLQEVAAAFAVAAGYAVFAVLDRNRVLAAVAGAVLAVAVAALASGIEHPGAVAWTVIGAAMVATGVAARRREHSG